MSFFYPLLIFSFSMSQCVIIFLLDLFTMCKIVATLLLFPRCQHYIADDYRDEPDFDIVYQFNTSGGLNSMSAIKFSF